MGLEEKTIKTRLSLNTVRPLLLIGLTISANASALEQYACFLTGSDHPPTKLSIVDITIRADWPTLDQRFERGTQLYEMTRPSQKLGQDSSCDLFQTYHFPGQMVKTFCWQAETKQFFEANNIFNKEMYDDPRFNTVDVYAGYS